MNTDDKTRTVLLVDDEPEIRKILAGILATENISTVEASNGREALEILKVKTFQAVVCDIMMPEMNGMECLEQANMEGIWTPFIFLTALSDFTRMMQAIRLGAVDFINKPFEADEIIQVVFRAVEIGARRNHILNAIETTNMALSQNSESEEDQVSYLPFNNKRRAK